ncbi:DinB family protein [Paenibacillus cellulositrophicus]|uniref:DinB family protein n=1 Tax=Paenibacillus cellulositrophicus TaxID=562959 RepID=UPI00126740F6|nr:DinB family protein [Paenibacillus cellulositrophicus]
MSDDINTKSSIQDYLATAELIQRSIAGLTTDQLEWKPAPDKWSVKEVVAHLVDSSLVHSVRIRKIIAESEQPLLLYNQDKWVSSARSNQSSLSDILTAFDALLTYNKLFYERLSDADWSKSGPNQDQTVSVSELFEGFIRHVHTHIAQIERVRAQISFNTSI